MTEKPLERIRADHVGSLVRPDRLMEMRARVDRGEATADELRSMEDECIAEVIAKQEEIGLPVVNDGEFRRSNFQDSFGAAVSGYEPSESAASYQEWLRRHTPGQRGRVVSGPAVGGPPLVTRRAATSRLQLVRNVTLGEYRFAARVARGPVKVTLISADRVARRFDYERSRGVYEGPADFIGHVARIEHEMVRQLVEAGCQYVQIDAPGYTAYVDPPSLEGMRARGEDPRENLERSIEADNAVMKGFPGTTFGIHLCRGNVRTVDPQTGSMVAQWHREGHYDAIAERLFNGLEHARFLLEYDSERAGSFEPLRFVPRNKVVVLGLVSTKTTDVESVDYLKRRLDQAAKYIPLDQLALSPQCGFASAAFDTVPGEVQWRKLEAVLQTSAQVWGR